jgi:GNAT superfamily N-acetyltransferase
MPTVIHLVRLLDQVPEVVVCNHFAIRNYSGEHDLQPWLDLRQRAFAGQTLAVGPWTLADLRRELLEQTWWHPSRLWLAEDAQPGELAGAVALAVAGRADRPRFAVHWLMVAPRARRRGLARALLARLERSVWELGGRAVWVETHRQWTPAWDFYLSQGYQVPA